jgi:hypothetical protein
LKLKTTVPQDADGARVSEKQGLEFPELTNTGVVDDGMLRR